MTDEQDHIQQLTALADQADAAGMRISIVHTKHLRALLADRAQLAADVEQLQVELGHALAPDGDEDEYEPLTLRDVDPEYVAQCEEDDRIADMVHEPGQYGEAPF